MSVSKKHLNHYKRLVSLCNDVAELRKKLDMYVSLCEVSDTFYCETTYLDSEDRSLAEIHQELSDSILAIEEGDYDEENQDE